MLAQQFQGRQAAIDRFSDTRSQALSLFADKGYGNVGMRELASALGVTCGSIYNHIESKEALLYEFFEELLELLRFKAEQIQQRVAAPARLRAIIEMHLELQRYMPCHFLIMEREWPTLSEPWLGQAAAQRLRYEETVAAALGDWGADLGCAKAVVTLLNQAQAWLPRVAARTEQRVELVHGVIKVMLDQAAPQQGLTGLGLTD
ncbi:TetR/AcrR family transcriptional regulator [Pseudomonas capeferrum]|uniref:TetR/AcrR family transcriptional regulator n=1 Tax=Pseudomonas capeferrum TaxID=1495066 RepID=UPI0015E2B95A|nr:TetR/AcrR family transcriptional regulator [Pseudomonas capeferrum]MBA1204803.1 TetR/AcrR family transcriptional regulator [Pseudomonas capeferrum]